MKLLAAAKRKRLRDKNIMRRFLGLLLTGCLLWAGACGELRPVPAPVEPKAYKAIDYQDLLDPAKAGLQAGELIRVKAYFWQYLDYDPAMVRSYLTLPRYPIRWYRLRWFAVYGSEKMTGYYDLAAISPEQEEKYQPKRLDPILIYGEISPLKPGFFLRVHRIEKSEEP